MVDIKKVGIVSVRHTGYNFTEQLLKECVGSVKGFHWIHHNTVEVFPEIVISPIRHPKLVYRTWYSRNEFGEGFFKEWEIFNDHWLAGNVHVLPLDTKDRGLHLKNLGKLLEVDLKTDWALVEHKQNFEPPEIDLARVFRLDVVREYYEF